MSASPSGSPWLAWFLVCCLFPTAAVAQDKGPDTRPAPGRELLEEESRLRYEKGSFVAVPIPISNPTVGSGLIGGGAYFYPQSEAQAARQPASITGVAAMGTDNGSKAVGLFQQSYWLNNRWRFTGAIGAADLRLQLLAPESDVVTRTVDWRIEGGFAFSRLSREFAPGWYGGALYRLVSTKQGLEFGTNFDAPEQFDLSTRFQSSGFGLSVEYDDRDMPSNPHRGRYLKGELLANGKDLGSDQNYETLKVALNRYWRLAERFVLAADAKACHQWGTVPLWDGCRIPLRGFAAFDYLGDGSLAGQLEGRWRVGGRIGAALFAGSGIVQNSLGRSGRSQRVNSYGVGLRYEVLAAKRINLRIDFARSDNDQGIYISAGEAF